jgi:RNA polymerase subunit RPABC4/transcription elongation factor Spt4
MRTYADRYNRCPSCNHEFPHHWSGCSVVRDQRI